MKRRTYRSALALVPGIGLAALGCVSPGGLPNPDGAAAIGPRAAKVYRTEWTVKAGAPRESAAAPSKSAVAATTPPAAPPVVQASATSDIKPAIVPAVATAPAPEPAPALPSPPALSLTIPPPPLPAPPVLPLAIPPVPPGR
jgi:hypothetical protein